jgi:pyruvate,water dikinase
MKYTIPFSEIRINDIASVGGKNASLGEMYSLLSPQGISVPDGFAITADAYRLFLHLNNLETFISSRLSAIDTGTFSNLGSMAQEIRAAIMQAHFPESLEAEIISAYQSLTSKAAPGKTFAVRSSATAEDLPTASFAGQQESFLTRSLPTEPLNTVTTTVLST